MRGKKSTKMRLGRGIFGFFFAIISIFSLLGNALLPQGVVYADPVNGNEAVTGENSGTTEATETENTENNTENTESTENTSSASGDSCKDSLGAIGWLVCPTTGAISEAVDWLFDKIEEILVINPVSTEDGSPIYEIWKYCRGITNIVFIIFLLVIVYSQITGLGISNYGIKKALPKLIVTAILVNLSFLICSLAVDVSNIVGNGLRGVFISVEETALATSSMEMGRISLSSVYSSLAGGTALGIGALFIAFETGAIWMLIPVVLGAIVAVATGLITIALRQAVVALLIMISPLAIVAYILPNTEKWFTKWKELLTRMLVFYPMFSLLFGASSLAGFAIIMSATDGFWLLLGIAVQIFPLFFSWKLMQMSGTFLGDINARLRSLAATPLAKNRAWAESRKINRRANTLARGVTPSAGLMQYLEKRRVLREEDTKNALEIASSKSVEYTQRKIANSEIGDLGAKSRRTSKYTRNAKAARNYSQRAQNAAAHTDHVLGNYGDWFDNDSRDKVLAEQGRQAWADYNRAVFQKEIDDENDVEWWVNRYHQANRRDENNQPVDEEAFQRYVRSVTGPDGEERMLAKVLTQSAKVEARRRAETHNMWDKYKLNGYNKAAFRSWITGYKVDDDGWALDIHGKQLRDEHGNKIEIIQGDAITKAPEKLVLYDKRDEQGLYFDLKDQYGNIVARVHRGTGADGKNHDDVAFIKETLANYDIPIADPIDNIYGILSGVKPGDVITPQGQNEIGLARYSTTIGGAMSAYKGDAAWAGAMFNSGIGNRQIKNSAEYALWILDSIKKTMKPGAFNTQNPASVKTIRTILDPNNWEEIFADEYIINAVNINGEPFGGEDWEYDENGEPIWENGEIRHTSVANPNHEQRMNTIKRKLLFPAMSKVLPALDRLRTSNTTDNQKPGTADEEYELLRMVEREWEGDGVEFDPTLVRQDLHSAVREFRKRKHDEDGNLIYATEPEPRQRPDDRGGVPNLRNLLDDAYSMAFTAEDLRDDVLRILSSRDEYARALQYFEEFCNLNPDPRMRDIVEQFDDIAAQANF